MGRNPRGSHEHASASRHAASAAAGKVRGAPAKSSCSGCRRSRWRSPDRDVADERTAGRVTVEAAGAMNGPSWGAPDCRSVAGGRRGRSYDRAGARAPACRPRARDQRGGRLARAACRAATSRPRPSSPECREGVSSRCFARLHKCETTLTSGSLWILRRVVCGTCRLPLSRTLPVLSRDEPRHSLPSN